MMNNVGKCVILANAGIHRHSETGWILDQAFWEFVRGRRPRLPIPVNSTFPTNSMLNVKSYPFICETIENMSVLVVAVACPASAFANARHKNPIKPGMIGRKTHKVYAFSAKRTHSVVERQGVKIL